MLPSIGFNRPVSVFAAFDGVLRILRSFQPEARYIAVERSIFDEPWSLRLMRAFILMVSPATSRLGWVRGLTGPPLIYRASWRALARKAAAQCYPLASRSAA